MALLGIIMIATRIYMAYDTFIHRNQRNATENFVILLGWVFFFFTIWGVIRG